MIPQGGPGKGVCLKRARPPVLARGRCTKRPTAIGRPRSRKGRSWREVHFKFEFPAQRGRFEKPTAIGPAWLALALGREEKREKRDDGPTEKEAKNPVIFKHKTESGHDPGHAIERTLATLTMKLQKTNNRHLDRLSIPEPGEGHYQKGRQRGRTPYPQSKMADAARAEFLKAKAKEVSQKGKAARKKGKGKAEAAADAGEKPRDWVELDAETYELLEKANEGRDEMLIPNWNRIKNEKVRTNIIIPGKPQIKTKGRIISPHMKVCDYSRLIRKCHFQMHSPASWQDTIKNELYRLVKEKKGPHPHFKSIQKTAKRNAEQMDSSTSGQPPEAKRAETMEVDPQQGPPIPTKAAKKETPMHYKAKIKVYPDESDNATEFLPEDLVSKPLKAEVLGENRKLLHTKTADPYTLSKGKMATELTDVLTFQEYLNDCCETELADNEDVSLLGRILDFTIHLGVGSILCENYGAASKLVELLNGLYNNGRTYTVYIEQVGRLGPLPEGAVKGRPLGHYLFGYVKTVDLTSLEANFGLSIFQDRSAVPSQHPEGREGDSELLHLQQENDPKGGQVRVAGTGPGTREKEERGEEGTLPLLQIPDRWLGAEGPDRPSSQGRVELDVHEPLPRWDYRCARLLQFEGGTAVHLGVVQGEGGEPSTCRRRGELPELEIVDPQGEMMENDERNMAMKSLLEAKDVINALNTTREKREGRKYKKPRSFRPNNE